MKKILQKVFSIFTKKNLKLRTKKRKSTGQSLVEFGLLLPILLMLFSGMVEFGFMLNSYLSLLDATRQAARLCSNRNPFRLDAATNTLVDDVNFYPFCAQAVVDSLAPPDDPNARRIELLQDRDDVIISVLRVNVNPDTNAISLIERFPEGTPPPLFFSYYGNQESRYADNADIEDFMTQNSTTPVETGILIVEVVYGYEGVLKLPWVEAFMSGADPVMLHASTIMPLVAAKP
jgi:hypothetical protein